MSFVDYGFDVFSFGSYRRPSGLQSCGDCLAKDSLENVWGGKQLENSCFHVIIDHLIDLGTATEHELALTRKELGKYKRLKLTGEQIDELRSFEIEYKNEDIERFIRSSKLETSGRSFVTDTSDNPPSETCCNAWNLAGNSSSLDKSALSCCKSLSPRQETCTSVDDDVASSPRSTQRGGLVSEEVFRSTIIQKDSEIISLKNENAAKETELRELREQNIKLDLIMEKMKDDIELLESSSKISQSQIQDIVRLKNEELNVSRDNSKKLEQELKEEREVRIFHEQEIMKLQALIRETQVLRKNLTSELKLAKHHIEAMESSSVSQANMIKQLQQERDNLDKQNREQESEIEKLLAIVKRLNEKYEWSKSDMLNAKDELKISELKVRQCREQLQTMEKEISRLIADLAECLEQTRSDKPALKSPKDNILDADENPMYKQARLMTRDVVRIVREHEQCRTQREELLREIERLVTINRNQVLPAIGDIQEIKLDANQEIAKLKEIILCTDNYRSVKMELKNIVDELIMRVDNKRIEKVEQIYSNVVNEASLSLENLNKKIMDHEIFQKCVNFLLLILKNLEQALDHAEKKIKDFGIDSSMDIPQLQLNCWSEEEEIRKKLIDGNEDYSLVENVLSKEILQRVQNSTQIVIRINAALCSDSGLKKLETYKKKLESELERTKSALNEISVGKSKLQSELEKSLKNNKELSLELDKLGAFLNEKLTENERMQSRLESSHQENDTLRKQIQSLEKKLRESRTDNADLLQKSDEIIENLRRELDARNFEIQQYGKFNDILNAKLEESNQVIQQLRSALVQESMRKFDVDSTFLHDRVVELGREKDELTMKIAVLESQLTGYETSNQRLQSNLDKVLKDNQQLEERIANVTSGETGSEEKSRVAVKCEELLQRIGRMSRKGKTAQNGGGDSPVVRGLEREVMSLKEMVRQQQKDLAVKEKEILDKNNKLENLSNQIKEGKQNADRLAVLSKQIDVLTREKDELKNELQQTLKRYNDKLAEMHKQYKHHEIELLKNHEDSIRRLEAKYSELEKEEGKIFGSTNWLQSLTAKQLQDLHDRICKTPLCFNSMYSRDLHEEQKKGNVNKNTTSIYSPQKPLPPKKEMKSLRNSTSSVSKSSSRQRLSARSTLSNHFINVPEKDYSR